MDGGGALLLGEANKMLASSNSSRMATILNCSFLLSSSLRKKKNGEKK